MAKPKGGKPKLTACTPEDVFGAIKKLGGFEIRFESAKHTKLIHIATNQAFTIPRHSPVNKHLLKDFVEKFLVGVCHLDEKEIYKHLWC
ncbi:MAG: hypothetical protein V1704_04880 [Candidatus Vogelbacteria bacterium]